MIIMGIDPGTAITGIGIIALQDENLSLLKYRAVKTVSKSELPLRLKSIYNAVMEDAEMFSPQVCAVEDVFSGINIRSALQIGQARGAAMMAAVNRGIEIAQYTPREVKMSVVGNGNASKKQVQFMVRNLLNLQHNPEPIDCADALAVAICHANRMKLNEKI